MMRKVIKATFYLIVITLILGFLLPNIFNDREEKAFSDVARLNKAKRKYIKDQIGDSVLTELSDFYNRGKIATTFLGQHYRKIWKEEISVPVLDLTKARHSMTFLKIGGGEQTISVDIVDTAGLTYTLRSVNKDQSRALPAILQYSFLRPLFRDQTSALNPFGALITADLEDACNILHTSPKMYFIPYDSMLNEKLLQQLAGRVVLFEEEPDNAWSKHSLFNQPDEIIKTANMLQRVENNTLTVDVREYLKCRLLDILISDWDRHENQWAWAVFRATDGPISQPIPMDRDMAFYSFNDGLLNHLALAINNKFQSFNPEYGDISGLIKNSKNLDKKLLSGLDTVDFVAQANAIKLDLNDDIIENAFQKYPPQVYKIYGERHINTLRKRLTKLDKAAIEFYSLLQD